MLHSTLAKCQEVLMQWLIYYLAGSSHMVQNNFCWDASFTVGIPARLSFVLKLPLRYFRLSVICSVPCDRIL